MKKIAIIGLGYVGLPLAVAFSEKYPVIGYDIAMWRVDELNSGYDRTLEVSEEELKAAINRGIKFTNKLDEIDVINELKDFGVRVDVYDPWTSKEEVKYEYGLDLIDNGELKIDNYDAIILAVAHNEFKEFDIEPTDNQVVYDIKSILKNADGRL